MKKVLLTLFLCLVGCFTEPDEARMTLMKAGFSEIQLGDTEWWACSNSDKYGLSFSAKNPAGQRVSGIVCCGQWKACTVRF